MPFPRKVAYGFRLFMSAEENLPSLMIVDDEPMNLEILSGYLEEAGYRVEKFGDGVSAVARAREAAPDLVLLDIMMPGMSGYDVCDELRRIPETRSVPVIILSALDRPEHKAKAFEMGARDYVTKPLQKTEVLARVRNHLQLRDYQLNLERLLQERSSELMEAHRQLRIWDQAKTDWLDTLAHELRTPLSGVFGVMDLVLADGEAEPLSEEMVGFYRSSRQRIEKLVKDANMLVSLQAEKRHQDWQVIRLNEVLELLRSEREGVSGVEVRVGDPDVEIFGEQTLLHRGLSDLLDLMEHLAPKGAAVHLELSAVWEGTASVEIMTTDGAVPEEALGTFFTVGGAMHFARNGTDLGLRPALAKRILELFRAEVRVSNRQEGGVRLQLLFPRYRAGVE